MNQSSIKPVNKFQFILDRMKNKTLEQARQDLIDAGIITANGQLAPKYQPKKQGR